MNRVLLGAAKHQYPLRINRFRAFVRRFCFFLGIACLEGQFNQSQISPVPLSPRSKDAGDINLRRSAWPTASRFGYLHYIHIIYIKTTFLQIL